jgi:predicted DCC family thiol-disulfide oxidoreductase YuxK
VEEPVLTAMAWESRPAPDLPDRLILYDGVCVLCSRMIRFVAARDPEGRWRFVPVQSPYGRRLAARFGIDPEAPQTVAVIRDGRAAFKLDAALAVLDGVPGWGWARLARLLPRPVRNWGYDRVARNRYRLFGRTESCSLPPPGLAGRVLTDEPAG